MESPIFIPQVAQVSSHAMDNLRKTIHENEVFNQQVDRVRTILRRWFNSQEHRLSFEKNL